MNGLEPLVKRWVFNESNFNIGVVKDVSDFLGGDVGATGDVGSATELDSAIGLNPFEAIVREDSDMGAGSSAEGGESRGEGFACFYELVKRERFPRACEGTTEKSRGVAVALRCLEEKVSDVSGDDSLAGGRAGGDQRFHRMRQLFALWGFLGFRRLSWVAIGYAGF